MINDLANLLIACFRIILSSMCSFKLVRLIHTFWRDWMLGIQANAVCIFVRLEVSKFECMNMFGSNIRRELLIPFIPVLLNPSVLSGKK